MGETLETSHIPQIGRHRDPSGQLHWSAVGQKVGDPFSCVASHEFSRFPQFSWLEGILLPSEKPQWLRKKMLLQEATTSVLVFGLSFLHCLDLIFLFFFSSSSVVV